MVGYLLAGEEIYGPSKYLKNITELLIPRCITLCMLMK